MATEALKRFFNNIRETLATPSGIKSQRFCWKYDDGLRHISTEEFLVATPLSNTMHAPMYNVPSEMDGLYSILKVHIQYETRLGKTISPRVMTVVPLAGSDRDRTHMIPLTEAMDRINDYNETMIRRCNRSGRKTGVAPQLNCMS